jgi:hypothetical protein
MKEIEKKVSGMTDQEISQVYKNVFDSDGGKIVMEDLKRTFFVRTSTAYILNEIKQLVHVSSDILQRNEGMRIPVLYIEQKINYDPSEEIEAGDAL